MTRRRERITSANPTLDIISDLPRNVIDCILERMPLRDAARTSILSRKWSDYWAALPKLVFDTRFFNDAVKNKGLLTQYEFERVINKIFFHHNGPILGVKLCIPEFHSFGQPDIDQWIVFLSQNGIKELTLDNQHCEPHTLPSRLFSTLKLTHLFIRNCIFRPPPSFRGFHNLISLECLKITFAANIFERLIANAPRLEKLTFVDCTGIDHFNIHAPNLEKLHFQANDEFKSICFKNTPNLNMVSIRLRKMVVNPMPHETSRLIDILGGLPRIEKLCLNNYFLKFLAAGTVPIPKGLPTTINQLTNLELHDVNFMNSDEVLCALCLIISSPNLQKLEILAFTRKDAVKEPILDYLKAQDYEGCTLDQLRIVKIRPIMGLKPELEFIKFLLASSPLLETMVIGSSPFLATMFEQSVLLEMMSIERREAIRSKAELKMASELIRFRRASPRAEIIY